MRVIEAHRDMRERMAFKQAVMFPQIGLAFETSADHAVVFDETRYSYNQPYKGATEFRKHFARVIGDLESKGEEHDCAVHIDRHPDVKVWARNTVRQPNFFWLQSSPNRFYPDFVCKLNDGRVVVVEYKGARLAGDPEERQKKMIGELWADRSGGACLFAWVENKNYLEFDRVIRSRI